jgi:hypothetical protein
MAMTKARRSTKGFTTLDAFLETEGDRNAFQAVAIKRGTGLADQASDGSAKAVVGGSRRAHADQSQSDEPSA